MLHPNQVALPVAVQGWIAEAYSLPADVAINRLWSKVGVIEDKLRLSADPDCDDETIEGLSQYDLLSAQADLLVEVRTLQRVAGRRMAA